MTDAYASVLVAHDSGVSGDWLSDEVVAEAGMSVADVVDSLSARSPRMQAATADVLVVACGQNSDDALDLVRWWVEHRPGRPVVMLCQDSPNGFVQRAFAAGADDLVVLEPDATVAAENLAFALQKAVARKTRPSEMQASLATMICVLGPKGGIGKTVTSGNLAVALASGGDRVAVVDLDLQFGDVALSLGLRPERTMYDLATSGGSLDAEKVDAYLTSHESGIQVLASPVRPDQAASITPEFAAEVIAALRSTYDYVVVDTPPSFGPEVIAAIDASSYVCVIAMLDALSLKNTRLGLETLDLMGYPRDRVRVLLNRANTSVGITGSDVTGILGRAPDTLIPSSRDITRSVNEGAPIVRSQKRSDAAKAFNELAGSFRTTRSSGPDKRRGRLLAVGRRRS
jgi:pilus assembly protein CpaE